MSLQKMLAAYDDNALTALSSKGLTRRARRDADAGKAAVTAQDETSAEILSDEQDVKISDKGLQMASCTCSATGICRHILTAVMTLRQAETAPGPAELTKDAEEQSDASPEEITQPLAPEAITITPAREEIANLKETFVIKFAGADLSAALALAGSVESPKIETQGVNVSVEFEDSPAIVTFIAGQGLKGALYKGPVTKKRLVVTACAVLIRRAAGVEIKNLPEEAEVSLHMSEADLAEMIDGIVQSVRAVLTGVPAIAADRLFDLAIAARVQTAPRLTAQLRSLAKQATLATSRHIDYDPAVFLENAANAYALCHAIAAFPDDTNLTGTLKRNYQPASALSLWMLGARTWRTPAGARGLTCYGYAPETRQWYETTAARGAGMDMTFSASQAYEGTIWRAGTPRAMMGKAVSLPVPAISSDNQISQTAAETGKISSEKLTLNALTEIGVMLESWHEAREYIQTRMGTGIRRKLFPVPFIIKPDSHLDISFDEMAQLYKWGIIDMNNEVLYLNLPVSAESAVRRIRAIRKKISAIMIAARFDGEVMIYEPVSILLNYKGAMTVLNIGLDNIEYKKILGFVKPKLTDFFPNFTSPVALNYSATAQLLSKALDTLVDVAVSPARQEQLFGVAQSCEQAGFTALANVLNITAKDISHEQILKAVYVVNETRQLSTLEG